MCRPSTHNRYKRGTVQEEKSIVEVAQMNLYNFSDAVKHRQSSLTEQTPDDENETNIRPAEDTADSTNERNNRPAEDAAADAKDSGEKQQGSTHGSETASRKNIAESQTLETSKKMPDTERNVASRLGTKTQEGDDGTDKEKDSPAASSDGMKQSHVARLLSGHGFSLHKKDDKVDLTTPAEAIEVPLGPADKAAWCDEGDAVRVGAFRQGHGSNVYDEEECTLGGNASHTQDVAHTQGEENLIHKAELVDKEKETREIIEGARLVFHDEILRNAPVAEAVVDNHRGFWSKRSILCITMLVALVIAGSVGIALGVKRSREASTLIPGNYCGYTWTNATNCEYGACPSGLDAECPGNTTCFADIQCFKAGHAEMGSNYCGFNIDDATSCKAGPCPGGQDSECPNGTSCFSAIVCPSGNFCGVNWTDATSCDFGTCPNGVDSECPDGMSCFAEIACS